MKDYQRPPHQFLLSSRVQRGRQLFCLWWLLLSWPGRPRSRVSGTAEYLAKCVGSGVPCSQVVGFAKKAMEDAVGTSSQVASCPVVRGLSKLKANDAEDRLHPLLAKHNLSLPIDLTPLSGDLLEGYPRLKPLHFLEYMAANGYLNRLLGGKQVAEARPMLEEFWRRFEVYHPDFGLFLVDDPDVELGLCIPVFAHADGGRGYKKSEFMVFNWSSVCGSGTAGGNKKDHSFRMLKRGKKEAQINLLGHSYGTHYMYSVMPAAWHKDDSCFQAMMTEFGKDLHECFETGVLHQGLRLRLVVLGLKADLKLQARAGRFTRWYSTCRKGPLDPTNLKQSPGLCCWLCPAGDVQFPFEEIHTDSPKWFEAIGEWAQWEETLAEQIVGDGLTFLQAYEFKPKHAIALSNFTILGGAIANTLANARRKHPQRPSEPLIDWDLILAMEPLTIFGAVFGSLLSKILPNFVLTSALVIILSLIGQRTLMKGCSMFREESRTLRPVEFELSDRVALAQASDVQDYIEFQSDSELAHGARGSRLRCKIAALTLCFAGTCALTLLKGGGRMASPLGVECGSIGFWLLYFGAVPWVLAFALGFRQMLVSEFHQKLQQGYTFQPGEVRWDSRNTLLYPLLCAIAGLLAGLFGVGGGIVKGPLMLEMGIMPSVASASAAAMILYTSAAASASFLVFGLLHPLYGALFFFLGLICTALGQYVVGQWVHKQNRQSPIVLSIGTVILLSSVFVAINTVVISIGRTRAELLAFHGVCDSAA
ncbi:unnamed protein product [Durusdinium trenchii]|uniref:Uncharacterized protein n=1 Tax=Durusdinium trenchii TaxID=1381693 RepID=A0ABP0I1K5_9DINO